jgi:hypothetical protein
LDILSSIIGAATSEFLTDKANENFLSFANYIIKPDNCTIYINTVDKVPVLNIIVDGTDEVVSIPIAVIYNSSAEFKRYYDIATPEGLYNCDIIAAFVVYFILKDYCDLTEEDDKAPMEKLARVLVKFVKFGNLKLDKLLSDLRKPVNPNKELEKTITKLVDKAIEDGEIKMEPESETLEK